MKQIFNNDSKGELFMATTDRRIRRTRRLLEAALLDLVDEQPYPSITIRDITDRADIGYATFFRHYDGKDDLMLQIFSRIVQDLEDWPERAGDSYFTEEGQRLFQHVADNAVLYRAVLDSLTFRRKLQALLATLVQSHLDSHANEVPQPAIPLDVAAQHIISSLLGLIDWWLANERPYSVNEMAQVYDRLLIGATWHALRHENEPHS
jgi:AcrR family transcriptional regulator